VFNLPKSNFKLIKEFNELKVLRLVKEEGPISRIDISKKTKISKPTISEITHRLIENGFLQEVGKGKSSFKGGKKPILLKLDFLAGAVIGIEIKRSFSNIALANLDSQIIRKYKITYPIGSSNKFIFDKIFNQIENILNLPEVKDTKKWGIAIGIPGLIDYSKGTLKVADTLQGWDNLSIRDIFENRFGFPTYVENDVKALSIGELFCGSGKNVKNLVCLWIGEGIGAGIIIDGKLMRGITGSAGEIGYNELGYWLKSKKNFSLLFDNQRDFGDIISEPVLINAAEKAIQKGYESTLYRSNPITLDSIGKAAESGDKLACSLLEEMGALIGIVCINLLNTVNPEMIIICGQIIEKCPTLLKLVQQNVHKDILHTPAEAVQICASKLKDEAVLKGAIGMVLHDWFEMPVNRIYPF